MPHQQLINFTTTICRRNVFKFENAAKPSTYHQTWTFTSNVDITYSSSYKSISLTIHTALYNLQQHDADL